MKIMFKKQILMGAFVVIVMAGGAIMYQSEIGNNNGYFSKTHTIVRNKNGFSPSQLVIKAGDSIVFISETDENFWPASDPHPTHDYLTAFDPGKSIERGEKWSLVFEETGTWRYHDHLNPSLRGEITVLSKEGGIKAEKYEDYCNPNDGKCFDEIIREEVSKNGIDAAWKLFTDKFEEGELPRACHWTAHQIGEAAYELFREGKEFPITYSTSYCGYGFYHGFLEGLLRENPDTDYALSFCDRVEKELGKQGRWNCYHGIGHGFTEDPPDPLVWGSFEGMIKPGIKMCEFLFGKSFFDLNLCLTGVFTVPAGFAEKSEYGLKIDSTNPFILCKNQPYRYHKACYGEFAPKLDSLPNWSLSKLPGILSSIEDDKTKNLIVWVVPSVMMARDILSDNHSKYILACRENFSGPMKNICLGGTILGLFSHGEPQKQYLKALEFCKDKNLTNDEKNVCWKEVAHRIYQEYNEEKRKEICPQVPDGFREICLTEKGFTSVYGDPTFEK